MERKKIIIIIRFLLFMSACKEFFFTCPVMHCNPLISSLFTIVSFIHFRGFIIENKFHIKVRKSKNYLGFLQKKKL